jgi:large conductance mechanosensitive channel
MSLMDEFKKFAVKGNAVDLAVGVIIGAAFGQVVNSLVKDVLMPPIGFMTGGLDFSNLFVDLSRTGYPSLKAAQEAGAPTVNYGVFINAIITFLIQAGALFVIVRVMNKVYRHEEAKAKAEPPPAPPRSEALLAEIRDLLKERSAKP